MAQTFATPQILGGANIGAWGGLSPESYLN
jgi:hypothetical protein